MSRFGNTSYNANSSTNSSSSSSNDYKDRDPILLDTYAIIEFDLITVGSYSGNYGANVILNMDDVVVREGVVTERVSDGKVKVFGWDHWFERDDETGELLPLPGSDEVSKDDLPTVETQEAGGDKYKYAVKKGVMEGADDPYELGDCDLWLGTSKAARTIAKVLSESGHGIIDEQNKRDDYDWLGFDPNNEQFDLRGELEGRRLMIWKESVTIPADQLDEDQDEDITFTDAVILDAQTESGITIKNDNDSSDVADGGTSDETDSGDSGSGSSEGVVEAGEIPTAVDNLIDMFARNNVTDREKVSRMINDELGQGESVSMDAVMDEIEQRQ